MKNKVIRIFTVIIISLICTSLLNCSYAGEPCKIDVDVKQKNPQPGDEIEIDVSFTYIHDPIGGLSFYIDDIFEKFEYLGVTATDFWDISLVGETFIVTSKNSEATTTTGKIATIRLKVKDNAVASTNTIKTHIQVATDDRSVFDVEEIDQITIQQKNEPQKENTSGGKTNTSGGDTNTSGGDNNTPGGNTAGGNNDRPGQNTNGGWWSSDSIDESRIVTINAGSSSDASAKSSDASTTTKTLPKTGRSTLIISGIVIAILSITFSYVLYRKYKNI